MSIVPLKKITVYGCIQDKLRVLDDLQTFGCLHLLSLVKKENLLDKGEQNGFKQAQEALKYLQDCPQKLKAVEEEAAIPANKNFEPQNGVTADSPGKGSPGRGNASLGKRDVAGIAEEGASFDAAAMQQAALENQRQVEVLQDEADKLGAQISQLKPWGNFTLPTLEELGGMRFWFYVVPHQEMKHFHAKCLQVIHKDNLFSYVVVIAEREPKNVPVQPVQLASRPLNELKKRVEAIEREIEDLQLHRIQLTRWLTLFQKNIAILYDRAALAAADASTYDSERLFAIQGWIPSSEVEKVRRFAQTQGLAMQVEDARIEEKPPTLLKNTPSLQGGEDLLTFYMTPNYWLWDPSKAIFFSFAIFFAMIFSDAGYAMILGAIVAVYWKQMGSTEGGKRFRNVLLTLTVFSLAWGVLVGSYFGVPLASHRYLSELKIIDMNNYAAMMKLSILVGVLHIVFANLAGAWAKRTSLTALASIGWALALIGGVLLFLGMKAAGIGLVGLGLLLVISFTSLERPLWKRFLKGFLELTRISGMFGDVLSYLRLFALGLASASLAAVFNDLAQQVYHAMSGFKILLALLILVIGHTMNFVLSLMSGWIHGLRLNFIEFFNWGMPEEGVPFKSFSKKERSKWNH